MLAKKTLAPAISIALLAILCGCGDVYRIRKFDANKPNGVPFYVKVGKCMQQTVKAAPYYRITLQISGGGEVKSFSASFTPESFKGSEVQTFLIEASQPAAPSDLLKLWKKLPTIDPLGQASSNASEQQLADALKLKFRVLSNSSSPATLVDYQTTYAGNAKSPFSGSANVDFKLSEDGTLSEASAQVEDNTFATVLGALPIADLIKSGAGIGAAAVDGGKPTVVQVSIQQRAVKITYTAFKDFSLGCPVGKALEEPGSSMSIQDVGAEQLSGGAQSPPDDSAIQVSGTIKLPKSTPSPGGGTGDKSGGKDASSKAGDGAGASSTAKAKSKGKGKGKGSQP